MDIKTMIEQYQLADAGDGTIAVYADVSDAVAEQIRAAKPQILAYLLNERQAAQAQQEQLQAVHLADTMGIDFNAAFGYVEGFQAERELLLEDEEAEEESISQIMTEDWLWRNAKDPAVLYCYFRCGLSVSSALWVVHPRVAV